MSRIIAGVARGRRLRTPPGSATRPTSDRVREALFSSLEAEFGSLRGVSFLDLFAGSGAVGLEAASRGADRVVAVESDQRTARLIRANAAEVGLRVEVVAQPVERFLARAAEAPFDIVFADPPYPLENRVLEGLLAQLADTGRLAPGGLLVVERSARSTEPCWPAGTTRIRSKSYGETLLWYVRGESEGAGG